jgi:hypothetical protein
LLVLNHYQFLDIVDKTAVFVARNGVQFEERIRENEKHNAKFSFLNPNDPYHAYYQYKIAETKEGKGIYFILSFSYKEESINYIL